MEKEILIETIVDLLEKGNSVELPATGYSMFPSIKPDVNVMVRPVQIDEILQPGSVIVCKIPSSFVMHRLIRITHDDSGNPWFITRGDAMSEEDKPWPMQQLIGIAISYKDGTSEKQLKPFIPGPLRYIYNRKLFWLYNFLKRLKSFMNS